MSVASVSHRSSLYAAPSIAMEDTSDGSSHRYHQRSIPPTPTIDMEVVSNLGSRRSVYATPSIDMEDVSDVTSYRSHMHVVSSTPSIDMENGSDMESRRSHMHIDSSIPSIDMEDLYDLDYVYDLSPSGSYLFIHPDSPSITLEDMEHMYDLVSEDFHLYDILAPSSSPAHISAVATCSTPVLASSSPHE